MIGAVAIGSAEPALSEVCDKTVFVGVDWRAAMGPESLFVPLSRSAVPASTAILLAFVIWWYGYHRVAWFAALALAMSAVLMTGWALFGTSVDDTRAFALAEGCSALSADLLSAFILLIGASLFALVAVTRIGGIKS
ncbi:MAG: hypothetical protein KDK75_19150 [Alphaproteobacteria bacterium]|nr:hypothetical protein [Alphaproteobacteria bacterium]